MTLGPGAIRDLEAHAYAGDAWIYSLAVPKVVINEIHYNPNSSDDLEEFVEITNADSVAVDISNWHLTEFASPGVTFPAGTIIQPGAYIVAAKDMATLAARLGCITTYEWGAQRQPQQRRRAGHSAGRERCAGGPYVLRRRYPLADDAGRRRSVAREDQPRGGYSLRFGDPAGVHVAGVGVGRFPRDER